MEEKEYKSKKIELVFPGTSLENESEFIRELPGGKILKQCTASLDDITKWFGGYQVNSIELWINGAIQTEKIIRLGVSSKGEGGLKLTLY